MSSSPKPAAEKADKKAKKSTKTKKAGAKKVSYAELIKEAIKAVGKPVKGASRTAIKSYIETHHKKDLHKNWTSTLKLSIRKLLSSGKLVQTKGSFRVSKAEAAASKKKGKRKAKKATKKSTKKATKKKSTKKTGGKKKAGAKKRSSSKKTTKASGTKKRAGAAKKGRKASRAKAVSDKRASSPAAA